MSNMYDLGSIETTVNSPFDFGSLLSGITGVAGSVYNMYTNKRDFDYQKALQQQIFQREDTAIQRRVEDLKEAGLNPVLAAGNGANSGSVVARSNTNDVNFGAALDYIQAMQQLKNQREENRLIRANARKAYYEANVYEHTGDAQAYKADYERDWYNYLSGYTYDMSDKLIEYFDYQYKNMKNSSELLQKQNNWFNANQITDILGDYIPNYGFSFSKRLK